MGKLLCLMGFHKYVVLYDHFGNRNTRKKICDRCGYKTKI